MNKYFVRYFIETPNSIGNRRDIENDKTGGWKFNFGHNKIMLYDCKQGFWADCYVEAESQELAEEESKTFTENILNLIDFSVSSASNSPLLISIYDATVRLKDRSFKQIFYITIEERNINPIDKNIFEVSFDNFNRNQDERIVRAISWLRKGYLESKHVDRFIAFWTGLEAINELLVDHFQIPDNEKKLKCPHCKKQLWPISAGIERLFKELGRSDNFNEIRKHRGKLLHGGGPLDNFFVQDIKQHNPLVRKILIKGIGKLLQMDNKTIENIIQQGTKTYNEKIRLIIKADLSEFDPPALDKFGKQPRIDLIKQNSLEKAISEKGELSLKNQTSFKVFNANFNNIIVEMWSDDNTCIKTIKIDNIK